MLKIIVTGKIVEVVPAPDTDEQWSGSMVLEESYFIEGGRFARYWSVYVPAYCRRQFKKICESGKYVGVESEFITPVETSEAKVAMVGAIRARALFLL